MASPEDRDKRRKRMRNRVAKDLRTVKFKQRIVEDKKKHVDIKNLTHSELVRLIQEEDDGNV